MPLFSKSIQDLPDVNDGIRVCIMRKPDFNAPWDIWMPTLSPPLDLHKAYQGGTVDWDGYVKRFVPEVIVARHNHIQLLVDMAKNNTITVLCWEHTPEKCHRRLIVEEALRINPNLHTEIL